MNPTILLAGLFLCASVHAAESEGAAAPMKAHYAPDSGRAQIAEGGRPVLVYNYKTVPQPPDFKAPGSKYAVPRSDYIHPLYGPDGQCLTLDWSPDHPHHRGIYWAWPEVQFRGQTGDLHALQRVWARPTGKILRTKLTFDPAKGRFLDDPEANALTSYKMRAPWKL